MTTLELPDHLVQALRSRAKREGRGVAEVVGDLLSPPVPETLEAPRFVIDPRTGMSVIHCPRVPPPEEQLTPERIAEILHEQEVEWFHGLS